MSRNRNKNRKNENTKGYDMSIDEKKLEGLEEGKTTEVQDSVGTKEVQEPTETKEPTEEDKLAEEAQEPKQESDKGKESTEDLTEREEFILRIAEDIVKNMNNKNGLPNLRMFMTTFKRYLAGTDVHRSKIFLKALKSTLNLDENFIGLLAVCNTIIDIEADIKLEREFSYILTVLAHGIKENFSIDKTFDRQGLNMDIAKALENYANVE